MIKRNLLAELIQHLENEELSLIVGPRQAGKTTLMFLLKDYITQKNQKTLYLSLDTETNKQFFSSQANLIKKIELELGSQKGIVFIDEIQRKEDAGIFLKGIYDLHLPYKFIVSGSGSLELKEKIHESLAGRKRIFELGTVSFLEFFHFKTDYKYIGKLNDFCYLEQERINILLAEYINYGGYPRVILEDQAREKSRTIDEILHSYLEKDISSLLKIEKLDAFSTLMKILASQIGQMVNYSELTSTTGIAMQTLKKYLWYSEKTFVTQRISPYFKNIRKELTKSPLIYFYDLGLRNYLLGLWGTLSTPSELGFVFQNFIFNIIKEKLQFSSATLHFWRTKDKAEVDFVINFGNDVLPIEVKYKKFIAPDIERSLKSFIEKYNPAYAFIINLTFKHTTSWRNTTVVFLPFWELLEQDIQTICQR